MSVTPIRDDQAMIDTTTPAVAKLEPIDGAKPADDDTRLWGVTTILKSIGSNEGLIHWAAQETAKAAIKSARTVGTMVEEQGEDEAIKWLADSRYRTTKGARSAAELGTAVHGACEDYALTGTRPDVDDEVRPFLDQFDSWAQRFQPVYHAAEMTVYHPDLGYAGTLDAILEVDGFVALTDYKTSRKSVDARGKVTSPYPDVGLQLVAYKNAQGAAAWRPRRFEKWRRRYYLLGPAEREAMVPVPQVDGALCIHITPDHCDAYPVRVDDEVWLTFQYALEIAHWDNEVARTVIGDPLVPPTPRS